MHFKLLHWLYNYSIYRKYGKIRWAKHSRFQPDEVFCGSNLAVHWPPVLKIHGKTFTILSKTVKNYKSLAQQIFPC